MGNWGMLRSSLVQRGLMSDNTAMSIEVWEPTGGTKGKPIDIGLLEKFVDVAKGADSVSSSQLRSSGLDSEEWVMNQEEAAWESAEDLSSDDLIALVRFFTLVEQHVSGWEAGKKSPVIPLVKILKTRDEFSADLRKWIKSNTDNRYLPYGSAL